MPYGEWLTAMPPTSLNAGEKIVYFSLNFFLAKSCLQTCQYFSPKDPLGKLLLRTPLGANPRPYQQHNVRYRHFFSGISNAVKKI